MKKNVLPVHRMKYAAIVDYTAKTVWEMVTGVTTVTPAEAVRELSATVEMAAGNVPVYVKGVKSIVKIVRACCVLNAVIVLIV